jgi:hypothetical protein
VILACLGRVILSCSKYERFSVMGEIMNYIDDGEKLKVIIDEDSISTLFKSLFTTSCRQSLMVRLIFTRHIFSRFSFNTDVTIHLAQFLHNIDKRK